MEHRVTIRDIAREADVHFTTVSMALRNNPKLPPATRERIQELARSMGYRPDPVLGALNYYRHNRRTPRHQATLGWINNSARRDDSKRGPISGAYFRGARQRAEALGFALDEFWLREPGLTTARLHSILRARHIDGLLIAPQPSGVSGIDLRWDEVAAVKFGHSLRHPELHTLVPHQYHAMRTMLQELRKLGYRRIGVAMEPELDARADNNWQAAFWVDYHAQPAARRIAPLFISMPEEGEKFHAWFQKHRPEVVGVVGLRLAEFVRKLDLDIPRRLGLAVCGLTGQDTQVSGVRENGEKIGSMAVDVLTAMLARREVGIPENPQYLLVDGAWHPGKTVVPQA